MPFHSRLKGFIILISITLCSTQGLTTNSSFLSHQTWVHQAIDQSAPLSFFDENNDESLAHLESSSPPPSLSLSPPPSQSSSIKLSMSRTLSSLGMQAYSVVLSKDGKTAFVSIVDSGDIKIFDVSNLNKITEIAVMRLIDPEYPFILSMLVLSPDGKTLFVSTMQFLYLIDVANPKAPKVLSLMKDQNLTDHFVGYYYHSKKYGFDYRISMAFSKDQNTLFIGGLGLQVVDISNKQNPKLISSNTDQVTEEDLLFTEVRTSNNLLYLANGTLNIFNITTPRTMKLLGSYSIEEHLITSIFLSEQDNGTVFIAGHQTYFGEYKTFFQKIDARDPTNPLKIKSYGMICKGLSSNEYDYISRGNVYILGISFNETIAYIFSFPKESEIEFALFNLQKNRFIKERRFLRDSITSVAIFPADDTKIIVAQNFDTLEVLSFYTNFPNKRIYSSTNTSIASFYFQLEFDTRSMILSPDSDILIVKGYNMLEKTEKKQVVLRIYNVSNPSKPQFMTSFDSIAPSSAIRFLQDVNKIVLLKGSENNISFLSLSENLKTLELAQSFSTKGLGKLEAIHFSPDGKTGYFVCSHFGDPDVPEDAFLLRTVSFSPFSSDLKILSEIDFTFPSSFQSLLTKDSRFLFIIGSKMTVYDVSNPSKPREISSISIDFHYKKTRPKLAYFSSDEKTIFTRIFDGVKFTLRIYDVQDLSSIRFLSDMPLPTRYDTTKVDRTFAFSPDYKTAYMGFEKGHIIAINMSDYNSPFVQGTFSLAAEDDVIDLVMAKDGKTIYYQNDHFIQVAILQAPYSLFMDTEAVRLGEKYSQSTALLKFNRADDEYDLTTDDYKILKASLFDVQVNKNQLTPLDCREVSLPNWMSFDKENQILALAPTKQDHIGTYTLYTAFSKRFPYDGFSAIQLARNKSANDDELLMLMISLGYIDRQLYLAPMLETADDFATATPSSLSNSLKYEMYRTLKKYYFETFTMFDILPSLNVKYSDKIMIETLSESQIRVEISLYGDLNRFVKKQYASLKPAILGSQIIFVGLQKDVNSALELLVINVEDPQECEGTVTINDRLNPVTTKYFFNISKLFKVNQPPRMEIPIQKQIDSQNVETGTYFTINLKNGTFVDVWNNDLDFDLTNGDPNKSLPSWISFSNMSLRGTPPEEIAWRPIKFNLIVSNEFKSVKIPFTLTVKLSPTFGLKLLARYSPYILTMIGLVVYANRIYNIICKRRYRYFRDVYLKAGEEITSSVIPPMIFVWKEKQESLIILKHLKARIAQELGRASITNTEVAEYFANSEGSRIDKVKLQVNIGEATEKITKRLRSYFHGAEERKIMIDQLIFNQLTIWLLEKHKETKKFFDTIKSDWIDLVEWDLNGKCKVKESQFLEVVTQADIHLENNSPHESLIKEVINVDLLKDAIESYALHKQSINHHPTTAHVMIKFRIQKDFIRNFFKKDLEDVNFSDRGKMTYGIYFKVENDVLSFHGVPEKRFVDQTMVIQVTTKKQRILSEIWIHGVSKGQERESIYSEGNEDRARGKGYEVY